MPLAKLSKPAPSGSQFLRFRCTDCGNCCTDTIVPLTHLDVKRLVEGLGAKAEEILRFYKDSEFADNGEGLQFVELDSGPRVMGLKRHWDESEGREACYFYENKRCTAYEHRPINCRNWPFDVILDDKGNIRRFSINKEIPCPYELDGPGLNERELKKNWRLDDDQERLYAEKVKSWNRGRAGGTSAEFLQYLKLTGES